MTTTYTIHGDAQICITGSQIRIVTPDITFVTTIQPDTAPAVDSETTRPPAPEQLPKPAPELLKNPARQRNKKLNIELIVEEDTLPEKFTPDEVKRMRDDEIIAHFIRITGKEELSCSCCKKSKKIVPNWVNTIRRRCSKEGISTNIKLPKTCDKTLARNDACNPINNPAYSKLRSTKSTIDQKICALRERQEKIREIGLESCPRKYIV